MKVVPSKTKGRGRGAPVQAALLPAPAELRAQPPAGPRPEAEGGGPAQISQAAAKLARLSARLGLPDAAALQASGATLLIDPYARPAAAAHAEALPAAGGVISGAIGLADELSRTRAQLAAAVRLYAAVGQLAGAVTGTRRLYAAALLRIGRGLVGRVRALLADERLPRREREKLRSDAAELLALDDRLRAGRAERGAETRGKKAEVAAQVGEVRRQQQLFETLLSLHRGEPVPAADAAAAVETYDALVSPQPPSPAPAGRGARRR